MSLCCCDRTTEFRITGEVWSHERVNAVGGGEKAIRVRCGQCGGKVGRVGSDLLVMLGIPEQEVRNGRALPADEHREVTIDLC